MFIRAVTTLIIANCHYAYIQFLKFGSQMLKFQGVQPLQAEQLFRADNVYKGGNHFDNIKLSLCVYTVSQVWFTNVKIPGTGDSNIYNLPIHPEIPQQKIFLINWFLQRIYSLR